ncbi:MAG: hypothetical protein AB7V27_12250 [Candidatus Binatia bacterium]
MRKRKQLVLALAGSVLGIVASADWASAQTYAPSDWGRQGRMKDPEDRDPGVFQTQSGRLARYDSDHPNKPPWSHEHSPGDKDLGERMERIALGKPVNPNEPGTVMVGSTSAPTASSWTAR